MDGFRFPTIGVLLVSGLIAGLLAYTMSLRAAREERVMTPLERARELGQADIARMGREYLSDRVVPEMKPVLLDLLKDAEGYVDQYFKRAEKAIKEM